MKYREYFKEVRAFTAGIFVVGGWYKKEEALKMIQDESEIEGISIEDIKEDRVRYGYPPYFVEDCDPSEGAVWYTGADGKGSMPVWLFNYWEFQTNEKTN